MASFDILHNSSDEKDAVLAVGLDHESAHPTMGITIATDNPYYMIYDGSYRTMSMNSAFLRYRKRFFIDRFSPCIFVDGHGYFYSKNTPELSGRTFGEGLGISGGTEFVLAVSDGIGIYVSLYGRKIFGILKNANGSEYIDSLGTAVLTGANETPVQGVETLAADAGVSFMIKPISRYLIVHGGYLWGNIFGFVDSREKRNVFDIGISLVSGK